jgi:hypothetical protein
LAIIGLGWPAGRAGTTVPGSGGFGRSNQPEAAAVKEHEAMTVADSGQPVGRQPHSPVAETGCTQHPKRQSGGDEPQWSPVAETGCTGRRLGQRGDRQGAAMEFFAVPSIALQA